METPTNWSGRIIKIQVTDGDVRNNLLKLSRIVKRGHVAAGEKFHITALPSGEEFDTFVMENHKVFQIRGAIRRFYATAHIKGCDSICLKETAPGRWELSRWHPDLGTPTCTNW